jgi:beta-lactamase class D
MVLALGLGVAAPASRAAVASSPPEPAPATLCRTTARLDLGRFAEAIGERRVVFLAATAEGHCWASDERELDVRHAPWSTFKIPHLLIALETGAVTGADTRIDWDPVRHPRADYWPEDWARPQTLATAFQRSTAWYFQALVPRIGAEAYADWLRRFGYGNQLAAGDAFWLGGGLAISVREQVALLACLAADGCGASARSRAVLEEVALAGEVGGLRLYGKTGSGPVRPGELDGRFEGWYVGYVRDAQGPWTTAFALWSEGPSFASLRSFRRDFALQLLGELGRWPVDPERAAH